MRRRVLGVVMVVAILAVGLRAWAQATVEQNTIGYGSLVGSVAYPDGNAVDVTLDGDVVTFTAIMDGRMETVSYSLPCPGGADRLTVRASGRVVHLITEEETCGVDHWRYRIPDEMHDLTEGGQYFLPFVVSD